MRIVLTGGRGYLGTHLARELSARGHEVYTLDLAHSAEKNSFRCDVADFRQLDERLRSIEPDIVYHLAAEFGRMNGEHFYEQTWRTNAIGTKNLLVIQRDVGFRVVFFSSSEVYGNYPGLMTEALTTEKPLHQLNDYAISKWVGELQCLNHAATDGNEIVRVRLFNTYGPGEHWSPFRSVVAQFFYRAIKGLPINVYAGYRRTSTYVADTINALANISQNFIPGMVYNIAGDEMHEIVEVLQEVMKHVPDSGSIVTTLSEDVHNTVSKAPDNTAAKRDLDFIAATNLVDGIAETGFWFNRMYGFGDSNA